MDLLRKTSVGDLHMLDLAVFFQGKLRRTVYQIPKPRVDLYPLDMRAPSAYYSYATPPSTCLCFVISHEIPTK